MYEYVGMRVRTMCTSVSGYPFDLHNEPLRIGKGHMCTTKRNKEALVLVVSNGDLLPWVQIGDRYSDVVAGAKHDSFTSPLFGDGFS